MKKTLDLNQRKLIRRYLIWCYKTTKEDFDRIERYFTQFKADYHVLEILLKDKTFKDKKEARPYLEKINEFAQYIDKKEKRVFSQKFIDEEQTKVQPDYWYLSRRLAALEQTIIHFLGKKELLKIQELYEEEMTRRILEAREHK